MASEAALLIGAATGLVTAAAHAFVLVSKELCRIAKNDETGKSLKISGL
jgi:hypothetical protein